MMKLMTETRNLSGKGEKKRKTQKESPPADLYKECRFCLSFQHLSYTVQY